MVRGARDQVVRPRHDDVPEGLRDNDTAVAFYHVLERHLGEAAPGKDVRTEAAKGARTG